MKQLSKTTSYGRSATRAFASLILVAAVHVSFATGDDDQSLPAKVPAANNSSAQIECTTPDGRIVAVQSVLSDDGTLTCPLQEGRTTFVIKLPEAALRDRFTFVNENAAAAGKLKISVSNDQLPATSPKWVEVDGNIPFSNKRLFNVSMVGVEARYMKLSFDVAKGVRLAAADR